MVLTRIYLLQPLCQYSSYLYIYVEKNKKVKKFKGFDIYKIYCGSITTISQVTSVLYWLWCGIEWKAANNTHTHTTSIIWPVEHGGGGAKQGWFVIVSRIIQHFWQARERERERCVYRDVTCAVRARYIGVSTRESRAHTKSFKASPRAQSLIIYYLRDSYLDL